MNHSIHDQYRTRKKGHDHSEPERDQRASSRIGPTSVPQTSPPSANEPPLISWPTQGHTNSSIGLQGDQSNDYTQGLALREQSQLKSLTPTDLERSDQTRSYTAINSELSSHNNFEFSSVFPDRSREEAGICLADFSSLNQDGYVEGPRDDCHFQRSDLQGSTGTSDALIQASQRSRVWKPLEPG